MPSARCIGREPDPDGVRPRSADGRWTPVSRRPPCGRSRLGCPAAAGAAGPTPTVRGAAQTGRRGGRRAHRGDRHPLDGDDWRRGAGAVEDPAAHPALWRGGEPHQILVRWPICWSPWARTRRRSIWLPTLSSATPGTAITRGSPGSTLGSPQEAGADPPPGADGVMRRSKHRSRENA